MNACDVLRRHQHRQCRHERANSRYRTQYGGQTREEVRYPKSQLSLVRRRG